MVAHESTPDSQLVQPPVHPDLAFKLVIFGRRRPGTTLAQHHHHYRHVHGDLVLQNIAVDPDNAPRRYVQNQVIDGTYGPGTPGTPSTQVLALNRDFVTQIWFPDAAALGRARQSPFFLEKVNGDENNFVDLASVVFMPVREQVLLAGPAPQRSGVKFFGFVQRADGVASEDFRHAWSNLSCTSDGSPAPLRHLKNIAMPTPQGPPAVDGIDECWFADEAAARSFLLQWQSAVQQALVRPGLMAPSGHFALLVHEAVLHAGPA